MNLAQDIREAYNDLDLQPGANAEEVKTAYRRLAHVLHPDRHPEASGALMSRINQAYTKLIKHLASGPAQGCTQTQTRPRPARPAGHTRNYSWEDFKNPRNSRGRADRRRSNVKDFYRRAAKAAKAAADAAEAMARGVNQNKTRKQKPKTAPKPKTVLAPMQRPSAAGWRLIGLEERNGNIVYKVEIGGEPENISLPVRRQRPCRYCGGRGVYPHKNSDQNCPACGGRGSITRSDQVKVTLPKNWRPGQIIAAPSHIFVELLAARNGEAG